MTTDRHYHTLSDIVHTFPKRRDAIAIQRFTGFRIQKIGYDRLHHLSLQCAAYLQSLNIHKGDRILIWAANSPEWAVMYCACVISGVVLVPLDARNTPDFVKRVGEETEAKLLARTQFKRIENYSIQNLLIENLFTTIQQFDPVKTFPPIDPDDLAEIIYTSGTTGDPKGVMLTQGNLASNVTDVQDVIRTDETYHLLSVLPLSHALEQTGGFWTPLVGGGCITFIQVLKPSAMFEVFQRENITAMVLVPRLLSLLKQRIEKTLEEKGKSGYLRLGLKMSRFLPRTLMKLYFYPIHKRFNTGFHLFVSGGAALDEEVERFWKAIGFEVVQGYGLTETSPVLSVGKPGESRTGSVGKPLGSVEIRLGNDQEIWAKGPNLFTGYYKKPLVTAQVFEEDWFRTGDIGQFDEEGYLFIRSRKKDIIVTGDGVNVYPEDIENELLHTGKVKEACVIGIGEKQEEIHAVLILNNPETELSDLVYQVNQNLSPEQQIKSYSIWNAPEFPKTTTLKIKKNQVRENITVDGAAKPSAPTSEGTPVQRILSEIANCSIDSLDPGKTLGNDLGLSSMDRVELITRMEEEFRIDIDDQAVTVNTTVGDLESLVDQRGHQAAEVHFRRWTRSGWCSSIRFLFEWLILRPVMKLFCEVEVTGLDQFKETRGPLFFVANHTSHLDTALVQTLLPAHLGRRICPAAWKEYFDIEADDSFSAAFWKKLSWNIATIGFNIFPFPQSSGYRRSMVYAGELVDAGWSILLFPEGRRSESGKLNVFQEGIGLMAPAIGIPIVPVAIKGGEKILTHNQALPKRGTVKIAFGAPFTPQRGSTAEITAQIESEILKLYNTL